MDSVERSAAISTSVTLITQRKHATPLFQTASFAFLLEEMIVDSRIGRVQ